MNNKTQWMYRLCILLVSTIIIWLILTLIYFMIARGMYVQAFNPTLSF